MASAATLSGCGLRLPIEGAGIWHRSAPAHAASGCGTLATATDVPVWQGCHSSPDRTASGRRMDRASARSRRRDGGAVAPLRAAIAVLALYAVVLQAFLGGLMPIPAAADGLCAQHAASDSIPDRLPAHGHGDCCTAARATVTALTPRVAPVTLAWTAEARGGPAYRDVGQLGARAPPDRCGSPRGPPSA
jgi:hypothetical protein